MVSNLFSGVFMNLNSVDVIGILFGLYLVIFNKHFAQGCAKSRKMLGMEKYGQIAEEQESSLRILSVFGGIVIIILSVW